MGWGRGFSLRSSSSCGPLGYVWRGCLHGWRRQSGNDSGFPGGTIACICIAVLQCTQCFGSIADDDRIFIFIFTWIIIILVVLIVREGHVWYGPLRTSGPPSVTCPGPGPGPGFIPARSDRRGHSRQLVLLFGTDARFPRLFLTQGLSRQGYRRFRRRRCVRLRGYGPAGLRAGPIVSASVRPTRCDAKTTRPASFTSHRMHWHRHGAPNSSSTPPGRSTGGGSRDYSCPLLFLVHMHHSSDGCIEFLLQLIPLSLFPGQLVTPVRGCLFETETLCL